MGKSQGHLESTWADHRVTFDDQMGTWIDQRGTWGKLMLQRTIELSKEAIRRLTRRDTWTNQRSIEGFLGALSIPSCPPSSITVFA